MVEVQIHTLLVTCRSKRIAHIIVTSVTGSEKEDNNILGEESDNVSNNDWFCRSWHC